MLVLYLASGLLSLVSHELCRRACLHAYELCGVMLAVSPHAQDVRACNLQLAGGHVSIASEAHNSLQGMHLSAHKKMDTNN